MENLEELFKKFVYTGVGMVSMAKDQLKKTIEEIIEKNKMNTEEGEKIIKNFTESAELKTKEINETINKIIENARSGFNFVKKSEIEELKKRIKTLEDLMHKK